MKNASISILLSLVILMAILPYAAGTIGFNPTRETKALFEKGLDNPGAFHSAQTSFSPIRAKDALGTAEHSFLSAKLITWESKINSNQVCMGIGEVKEQCFELREPTIAHPYYKVLYTGKYNKDARVSLMCDTSSEELVESVSAYVGYDLIIRNNLESNCKSICPENETCCAVIVENRRSKKKDANYMEECPNSGITDNEVDEILTKAEEEKNFDAIATPIIEITGILLFLVLIPFVVAYTLIKDKDGWKIVIIFLLAYYFFWFIIWPILTMVI